MKVVIHCSDSPFGNAAVIDYWHRNRPKSFRMIGYHLVILNGWIDPKHYHNRFNGHVETGRPFDDNKNIDTSEWGAHTKGENSQSIGVCLIGKSGQFSWKQLGALANELAELKKQFGEIEISQHSDHDPRKPFCAGLTEEEMQGLRDFIK